MGESRSINPAVAIAILAVVIGIVVFVFWRGAGPPTPRPRPGQSLDNPLGPQGAPMPPVQAPR